MVEEGTEQISCKGGGEEGLFMEEGGFVGEVEDEEACGRVGCDG